MREALPDGVAGGVEEEEAAGIRHDSDLYPKAGSVGRPNEGIPVGECEVSGGVEFYCCISSDGGYSTENPES